MAKFWWFFMVSLTWIPLALFSQNFLKNGGFEDVTEITFKDRRYAGAFYADNWFQPTSCTVDIFRDLSSCDSFHVKSFQPTLDFCLQTKSGDYCIGFLPIDFFGYMEHLTGVLKEKLIKDELYRVAFSIKKERSNTPYVPIGIGFKFHKDSILSEGLDYDDKHEGGKLKPYYYNIFAKNKIYSDFQINEYILDTNWVNHEFIFMAKGGEKYITFGRFAYQYDEEIIKQFKTTRRNPWEKKIMSFINRDKSLVNKNFFSRGKPDDASYYYFLDEIDVVKVKKDMSPNSEIYPECKECMFVDLDSSTNYPASRTINVDKGYEGLMTINIYAKLKPSEKLVLNYGKKGVVEIINTNEHGDRFDDIQYQLKCKARKLRKGPIVFSISKTTEEEYNSKDFQVIKNEAFSGLIKHTSEVTLVQPNTEFSASWIGIHGTWRDFGGFLGW